MNNKQTVFVSEYLKDFNATRAAKAAGYSEKTAKAIGAENLTKPDIQEAIKQVLSERAMGPDEVLQRLADIARGDMADLMAIGTTGFNIELMTIDDEGNKIVNPKTKLIKKIRQKVTTFIGKRKDDDDREIVETELELYSAFEALALLGKHHALFVDRTEITGKDGGKVEIEYVNTPYPTPGLPSGSGGNTSKPE